MAEYMLIPTRALVHKMDPKLKPEHAAFVEPLSCSLHGESIDCDRRLHKFLTLATAVERANIKFNDIVVVACGVLHLQLRT